MKRFIGVVFSLLVFALLVWAGAASRILPMSSQAADLWEQVLPVATPTPSPETASLIAALAARLQADQSHQPVLMLAGTSIEEVRLAEDGQWASALLVPADLESGETLPSEPGLALLSRTVDGWQVFLPNDEGWLKALQQTPDDLISPDRKAAWSEIYQSAIDLAPDEPLSGYLLPWAGGITRYLSQSISHDLYTPSGSAHYAFDFYSSGQLWNIYAAKSGTVWSWKDDVPTCLQYTCNTTQPYGNFIVLQDTTTTPTSYQLYLHLAQNSIPAELKQIGVPVQQGQMIGVADNTGQSWGHHLHFQVHTNPYSYWGYSVDIVFADVFINGGRPRTVSEASEGEIGRSDYLSLNFVQDDLVAPIGGLLDPFSDGFDVLDGKLQLAAWAIDQQSGVARAQIEAFYESEWRPVGLPFTTSQTSFEWDLCASGVPRGPLALRLDVVDFANNHTPANNSLRHGLNNSSCLPPPPTCTPTDYQVALYAGEDFSGACRLFSTGSYPSLADFSEFDLAAAASIRVGASVAATLYSGEDYTGRRETYTADDAGFSDNLVNDSSLASLKIHILTSVPDLPKVLLPAEGAVYTDETPLFFWQAGDNNASYLARILSGGVVTRTAELQYPFWRVNDLLPGDYQLQVQARNQDDTASSWTPLSSFSIAADQPATGTYTATYTAMFETIDPDWVWTGGWQVVNGGGHFRSAPQAFMITPAAPDEPARGSLTSPEIYLPDGNQTLTFYYRYQGETGRLWDQRRVQISGDDGPYQDVLQLTDDQPGIWLRSPVIDLAAYAGQHIRVRFAMHSLDPLNNEALSWEIDDFSVGPNEQVACSDPTDAGAQPAEALPIAVDEPLAGLICPGGDIDLYRLEVAEPGASVLFEIDAASLDSPLDSYLSLYDQDGASLLAYNDDAIPYTLTDSRLGYTFTRPGTYYLEVKAWDHPQAGSAEHFYNLLVSESAAGLFYAPRSGSKLEQPAAALQVLAQDNGGVVQSVSFWWHSGDWQSGDWQPIGTDEDGSDGWGLEFDTSQLADQRGLAFYALIEDRAGNKQVVAVWNLILETSGTVYLPIVNR